MAFYLTTCDQILGLSGSHVWSLRHGDGGWYVSGLAEFTQSGWAVVDDFGNLVQVPA